MVVSLVSFIARTVLIVVNFIVAVLGLPMITQLRNRSLRVLPLRYPNFSTVSLADFSVF